MPHVWSYPEGPRPQLIADCVQSWFQHLPGWLVSLLDKQGCLVLGLGLGEWFDNLTATTRFDVVQLSLLYQFGGLWLDGSTLLLHNFTWLVNCVHCQLLAYRIAGRPYIKSWFLYAPHAHNPLIKFWLHTLISILKTVPHTNHIAYARGACTGNNDYFMIYQAFCHSVHTNKAFRDMFCCVRWFNTTGCFYNPLIPSTNHNGLIKFTKMHRPLYKWVPFPVAFYILVCILSVVVILKRKY